MNERALNSRTFRKLRIVKYLGGRCRVCGYNKNLSALDVHHEDSGKKEENWDSVVRRSDWDAVLKAIDGCVLLCRNCHMETHFPLLEMADGELKNPMLRKPTGVCPVCGEDVYGLTYCSRKCDTMRRRKVERPSLDELVKMLQAKTFTEIGREFGVSDVAVHYWLRGKKKR
jgi:hypothetical protein